MFLGIDLGTTYSVGGYIGDNGEPQVIVNKEGSRITPSVVYFEDENSVIVGQVAKDNSMICPDDVVSAAKNFMGKKQSFKSSYGKEYTPEVISSFILKKIVSDGNSYLNPEKPIRDVVVTIPAYFTDSQRKSTEDAVKIAGLNLLGTINEPTAAALYYAYKTKMDQANILVYDLGGGTFDVTIIRLEGDQVVVKSTGGLSKVGGRFFDQDLVDYVCGYIEEKYDVDLEDEEYLDTYQELYGRAEKVKMQLGSQQKAHIAVRTGKIKENVEITREFFEGIVGKLYKRTEFVVKKAVKDAGIEFADIDKVVMAGGSSRIPYIEKHLAELTGLKPSREVNPDEVVSLGAALYGAQITRGNHKKSIQDVCSHSIGIVTLDRKTSKKINSIQIRRNSWLPVSVTNVFRTAVKNQQGIEFSITEGEFAELTDITIISTTYLALPEGLEQGTKIEITLQLDHAQLIHVFLKIPCVKYEKEFCFERNANLSEVDVARLTGLIADYEVY